MGCSKNGSRELLGKINLTLEDRNGSSNLPLDIPGNFDHRGMCTAFYIKLGRLSWEKV